MFSQAWISLIVTWKTQFPAKRPVQALTLISTRETGREISSEKHLSGGITRVGNRLGRQEGKARDKCRSPVYVESDISPARYVLHQLYRRHSTAFWRLGATIMLSP
jgi:hypothetical protein